MPTTISGLLVVLFGILPGVPGENLFRRVIGADWREEQWRRVLRMVGFSVGGLVLYLIVGSWINAPLPSYIFPTTFQSFPLDRGQLTYIAIALAGHTLGAVLAGLSSALIVCLINRLTPITGYPDTWDRFALSQVAKHWVVVRLENGETYAGMVHRADTSVCQSERDIVLSEPAQYVEEEKNYLALPYQFLFLPGSLVVSIAVVHDPNLDSRLSEVGRFLFPESPDGSKEKLV